MRQASGEAAVSSTGSASLPTVAFTGCVEVHSLCTAFIVDTATSDLSTISEGRLSGLPDTVEMDWVHIGKRQEQPGIWILPCGWLDSG